jgi:hypothetical protein
METKWKNDTRWKKGQSGNPKGRPKGVRNLRTLMFENIVKGRNKELLEKAMQLALSGDQQMLKLILERTLPPKPKESTVKLGINFADIKSYQDKCIAIDNLLADELITITEHKMLYESFTRAFDSVQMEQRIKKLEERVDA